MKRATLWLLTLLASAGLSAQEMTFKETTHDFGEIEEEYGKVNYDFQFTNTGDKPLIIKADAFSVQAVKMITLTGGQAIELKGE